MDIYEFAMQMEKDGENYYRDLAQKVDNKGLKNILSFLADAEVKHHDILKKMKDNEKTQLSETKILSDVKNVFEKMKEENDTSGADTSQIELYKDALEIEKKNHEFFLEKAEEVEDQAQKEILLKLADEEESHCTILENIINFVSQPDSWLEDAEWYHLEGN
ncbi:MAG: hypothetical protein SCARUB_01306 [Candidatus Scalindua rubra]|uniref:Rubrerythrin diiron-binding domain-containing protein n=1 Tax=Candidatus Scalindua rubra TaxID=1872076 RepID=A0A1E3XD59_9BACT|nr:MAG: hypothetical protein SCARUB_01306 [Candidatus Scalindua rubra]